MKTEAAQVKLHEVYKEVDISTLDPSTIREAILHDGYTVGKDYQFAHASSQKATARKSTTRTPCMHLHQCSQYYGHFYSYN